MRSAASMPTIETVEPIERSMLPIVMTNVSPSARTVRTAACCRTFVALPSEKKWLLRAEKMMMRTTRAITGPSVGADRQRLPASEPPPASFVEAAVDAALLISAFPLTCSFGPSGRSHHMRHDIDLTRLGVARRINFVDDRSAAHDEYAIAEADDLGQVVTYEEDANALRRDLAQDAVDLFLGARVDPVRRIVQHKNFRVSHEPAREQHLLLIAAAQRASWRPGAG